MPRAQNESLTQRAQVEEFVEQGVDLIIISPKEAAPLTRPVAEAYQRGTPVIVNYRGGEAQVDSGHEIRLLHWGSDRRVARRYAKRGSRRRATLPLQRRKGA